MESRLFEGFVENMPPAKTPVTIVFTPKVEEKKAEGGPGGEMEKWMNNGGDSGKGAFGDAAPEGKDAADKTDKGTEGTDKGEKAKE